MDNFLKHLDLLRGEAQNYIAGAITIDKLREAFEIHTEYMGCALDVEKRNGVDMAEKGLAKAAGPLFGPDEDDISGVGC